MVSNPALHLQERIGEAALLNCSSAMARHPVVFCLSNGPDSLLWHVQAMQKRKKLQNPRLALADSTVLQHALCHYFGGTFTS